MADLDLETRRGLPEALRVLLAEYPRAGWPEHGGFHGLVSFWLDRHMMFRRLTGLMQSETEALLDRRTDPKVYAGRLARLGGQFVNELHGHHRIEDLHYFPVLARAEPRIGAGFDLLDRDHHALDGHLERFVGAANGVLGSWREREGLQTAAGAFAGELGTVARLLDRHLIDEEELVVPVVLRHGAAGLG